MGYTLVIDNYDSFTWNIYADIATLGGNPLVRRNDKITIQDIETMYKAGDLDRIVISPGPGHPRTDSGISRDVIRWGMGKVPILGVCMGLECLVDVMGGEITYAGEIKHGKTSLVDHDGLGIFKDLPPLLSSTRYHSLSAHLLSLPKDLQVSATTQESGVIMAVRHRSLCVEAVQYHPESCMSEGGRGLMSNFIKMKGGYWGEENVWCGVSMENEIELNDPSNFEKSLNGHNNGLINGGPSIPTILNQIKSQRLLDIQSSSSLPHSTQSILSTSLALHTAPPLINFLNRITSTPHTAVMAEIKRASPSKGDIAPNTSAPAQALKYALVGASVISVLTEPKWFKGSLIDMLDVRRAIDSLPNRPAVLRKDFILSTYMIDEARLHGADTVLLIVAMLDPTLLKELYDYSVSLGMEPLVEVNNPSELSIALGIGAKVIGVNNRNLHDFNVDMETTSRVNAALEGRQVVLCALSGISSRNDVEKYVQEGVRAVLVGESLMRAENPQTFLRDLVGLPPLQSKTTYKPLVKICGIRTLSDAQMAVEAGADMIGIILASGYKRTISLSIARDISNYVHSISSKQQRISLTSPSSPETWFSTKARYLQSRRKPLLVGVFKDQPLEVILETVEEIGLDIVQLHGSEPQEWSKFIPVPVIKAFHISANGEVAGGQVDRPGENDYILLDAGNGEGKTFPWDHARDLIGRGEVGMGKEGKLPVILAGGLTSDNVEEALRQAGNVLAVDVSSGVELGEGKDEQRVRAFIKAVKG
ncbi:anthranilate synthase/indole-3-glycerol phosphate synthase/phosphoribosylanthranilate isomerase [Tremella mesenterica]|uniref:Multifunctional tryptophan biosynthesis protein n=1 Tax=Tremella mesenterica TaxID=5217 RepID=A0A4Q1BDN0_TREME|nr:anthranilate synthase/indole-3-glycerol phosphate synthase/phosphoribosylanthranilate isomerase [Tremella mesenterica]